MPKWVKIITFGGIKIDFLHQISVLSKMNNKRKIRKSTFKIDSSSSIPAAEGKEWKFLRRILISGIFSLILIFIILTENHLFKN